MDFIVLCFMSVFAYYFGFFIFLIFVTAFKDETKQDELLAKGAGLVFAIVIFGTNI
jgi:hypothetical protein